MKLRNTFKEYNPEEVAFINYELTDAKPDFATFKYGTAHSVVLRNQTTGELEQINFTICGDDGEFFPGARTLWGDIKSEDYHTILVFSMNDNEVTSVYASFCGNSISRSEFAKRVEEAPYGVAAVADDLFFRNSSP